MLGTAEAEGDRRNERWRRRLRRWRGRWARWRRRDGRRRTLLVRAAVLVLAFRVALRMLSFERVRALADAMGGGAGGGPADEGRAGASRGGAAEDAFAAVAGREVEAAARVLAPARPCLPQALACYVLLLRAGRPVSIHIGVRRDSADGDAGGPAGVEAHAWVESGGRVVAGGELAVDGEAGYVRLLDHGPGDG